MSGSNLTTLNSQCGQACVFIYTAHTVTRLSLSLSPSRSQFYRCFLILFHCNQRLLENGHSSMPSKTTVIQLNRRVYTNTVACTTQISTGVINQCCSTPATQRTNPPEVNS